MGDPFLTEKYRTTREIQSNRQMQSRINANCLWHPSNRGYRVVQFSIRGDGFVMKPPKKIEAKRILEDIRSGMDDLSLMNKYELSAKGLQSLFEQLGNIGLVRRLNARELLEDIRSGSARTDSLRNTSFQKMVCKDCSRNWIGRAF